VRMLWQAVKGCPQGGTAVVTLMSTGSRPSSIGQRDMVAGSVKVTELVVAMCTEEPRHVCGCILAMG
jgi:hypothetical protein